MNNLDNLKQVADEMFSGLKADEKGLRQILSGQKTVKPSFRLYRIVPVVAACAVLVFSLISLQQNKITNEGVPYIQTMVAGNGSLPGELWSHSLPHGAITLKPSGQAPQQGGLWAGSSGNFPLIGVNGRFYRLLTNPSSVPESMLGASLGSVSLLTNEPALSMNDPGIISNVVENGLEVYQAKGMGGACVLASVNGNYRLFQRVGFSGNAVIGNESFGDFLGNTKVVAMQLSGVGTVNDGDAISSLIRLISNADYLNNKTMRTSKTLLIEFDNHLVLQFSVEGDAISACGTWQAAGFTSEFAKYAK